MAHRKTERQPRPATQDNAAKAKLRLSVRVTPRASQDQLIRAGDSLKIRVTAAPVEGAANQALIELLAASLGLPKRSVHITSGATSREKIVEIEDLATPADLWKRLGL
ncbi:MAG: DUF167 domain-containing protein [Ktedonobacterales bacterium]